MHVTHLSHPRFRRVLVHAYPLLRKREKGVIMDKQPLTPGYYLGVSRRVRNFSFSLPKKRRGAPAMDMDSFWNQLINGKAATSSTPSNSATKEKSTSFSGWEKVTIAQNLSDKCYNAPGIYKAAGGDDPAVAEANVKAFKKNAAKILGRCADTDATIDEAIEREINLLSCTVHEIKVILLCVSNKEMPGTRFDGNTNLWYGERVLRKFYVTTLPVDDLLIAFRAELADPGTNVAGDMRLHAVRSDKVTHRTGRNAYTSGFRIETQSVLRDEDAAIRAARDRILAKVNSLKSTST